MPDSDAAFQPCNFIDVRRAHRWGGGAAPRSRMSETSESLSPQEVFVFRDIVGMAVRRWFGVSRCRVVVSSCAGSYVAPRGRTQLRAVVPFLAESYLRAPGGYDFAGSGTTSRPRVRPRGLGYDRTHSGTTARVALAATRVKPLVRCSVE